MGLRSADHRLARWRRGSCVTLACASALQSFFSKRGDVTDAGWRGLPSRDVGSGEERRRTGSPREAGRGARGALCARPQEQTCYAPPLRRSPGRRAPQRSRAKAAGRSRPRTSSRDGNPRRPASLRSPSAASAGKPLRYQAKRQRRRHHTLRHTRRSNRGGSCDYAQDDRPGCRVGSCDCAQDDKLGHRQTCGYAQDDRRGSGASCDCAQQAPGIRSSCGWPSPRARPAPARAATARPRAWPARASRSTSASA